jgi:hypothetical protein
VLVIRLVAAAMGPLAYAVVQGAIVSFFGQIVLLGATFAFFLHLCGAYAISSGTPSTVSSFARSTFQDGW